uniref:U11-Eretoxin-Ek1az_1 n=1 Tax=Eresus cinnaberinus TaxID=175337 RepID=A0A2D0PCR3_ERECI
MVSHVTSIVSLFALLLGLAECAKCPYAKFTPTALVSAKIQILNVLFWNEDYNQLTNNVL